MSRAAEFRARAESRRASILAYASARPGNTKGYGMVYGETEPLSHDVQVRRRKVTA